MAVQENIHTATVSFHLRDKLHLVLYSIYNGKPKKGIQTSDLYLMYLLENISQVSLEYWILHASELTEQLGLPLMKNEKKCQC